MTVEAVVKTKSAMNVKTAGKKKEAAKTMKAMKAIKAMEARTADAGEAKIEESTQNVEEPSAPVDPGFYTHYTFPDS